MEDAAGSPGTLATHALAARTGFVLIKLGEVVRSGAERTLGEVGLTGREFDLLASVAADESLSQRDVGRLLGLAPNVVGNIIDELEHRGLVTRARSRADRRRHVLTLTDEGQTLLRTAAAAATQGEHELLADLDPDEARTLHELASRVLSPRWPPAPPG